MAYLVCPLMNGKYCASEGCAFWEAGAKCCAILAFARVKTMWVAQREYPGENRSAVGSVDLEYTHTVACEECGRVCAAGTNCRCRDE